MNYVRSSLLCLAALFAGALFHFHRASAQTPPAKTEPITMPPNRVAHVLVIAQTKGFEHDSVPDAMANIWKWGHDTKLYEATLRTDTELITKKDIPKRNVKNLNYFDALIFASTT